MFSKPFNSFSMSTRRKRVGGVAHARFYPQSSRVEGCEPEDIA